MPPPTALTRLEEVLDQAVPRPPAQLLHILHFYPATLPWARGPNLLLLLLRSCPPLLLWPVPRAVLLAGRAVAHAQLVLLLLR